MIELLTTAQMAEADRLTITGGTPGIDLMESAGRAVADAVARWAGSGAPSVTVVAGPGNNGGDGFVCARILSERGFPVRLLMHGERDKLKGDAAQAAKRWRGQVEAATPEALSGAAIIVASVPNKGEPTAGYPAAYRLPPSRYGSLTGDQRGVRSLATPFVRLWVRPLGSVTMMLPTVKSPATKASCVPSVDQAGSRAAPGTPWMMRRAFPARVRTTMSASFGER